MNFEPNQGRHRDEGLGWKRLSDQRLQTFAQSAATRDGKRAEFSPSTATNDGVVATHTQPGASE